MSTGTRRLLGAFVALAVLAGWTASRLRVTTDIRHFLPEGRAGLDLTLARDLAFGELARTMVLVVRTGDAALAPSVSREFEEALRGEPRVSEQASFVDGGPPRDFERALWDLYEPRRFAFVAADPDAALASLSTTSLRDSAAELRARLATPMSTLLTRVAPGDPLLALPRLLEHIESSRGGGLDVVDGRFTADSGQSAVILCATRAPTSDNAAQRPFLAGIRAAFERVDAAHGGRLALETSGVNRYGVRMEDDMRRDIQRVSIGSVLLVTLIYLGFFGSLRLALLVVPVLAAGFIVGTASCQLFFGGVHGLTLAFGAALIGVSVDYTVHFHCQQILAPDPRGPRATLAGIWPGLMLGAATTILGFLALALSTFPGLRELAVFGASGIAAALVATRVFAPALAHIAAPTSSSADRARAAAIWLATYVVRRRRVFPLAVAVLVLLAIAVGLPRARWDDGLAALSRLDPALQAEDAAVQARIAGFDRRHVVVAVGADEQSALEVDDRVGDVLRAAERDGIVLGSWSAATLLPSAARQGAIDAVLRQDADLWGRMRSALSAEGFVPEAFTPFRDELRAPPPQPLQWSDLARSPIGPLVRSLRLEVTDFDSESERADAEPRIAFASFVRGTTDAAALRSRLEAVGARLVDIEGELSAAYGAYRSRMTLLLGVGLAGVVLLVALRHVFAREKTGLVRRTLVACVPAIVATALTVAVLALSGQSLNTLTLVALLMVASMGVDYGVFIAEPARSRAEREATQLSVGLAALTTVASFGLLALSDQPALRTLGLTAGLGVLFSFALVTIMQMALTEPAGVDRGES